ncbi:MAG: hypothetical protein Q7T68_06210 [Sphingopyxis sp.]|nr:hypothetical protein [Sphingopyxis sp.]
MQFHFIFPVMLDFPTPKKTQPNVVHSRSDEGLILDNKYLIAIAGRTYMMARKPFYPHTFLGQACAKGSEGAIDGARPSPRKGGPVKRSPFIDLAPPHAG